MEEEEEYRIRGLLWEKKRDRDKRWDKAFWTRERKYSPRRLILRSRLPPSLCQQASFSDKGEPDCNQQPVATFAIRREGVAKKKGRRRKGQMPPRCCLILAIALFERRSNARTEYAAKYLGP